MAENQRLVKCKKFGKEMPGLAKPPFSGPVGQQIFNETSREAWDMWRNDMQIKVLNEYRLNMANPKDYQILVEQMLQFLNLQEGGTLEVENAERGRRE
jgi:Fe-S cluster biosynthesis and repair protein YggX